MKRAAKPKAHAQPATATSFAKSQLRALVERIERLEEEKKALSDDIREVYGEAKANGFDTKALRAVVRMRGQEPAERQEFEAIVELYRDALGMTPLERYAARRDDEAVERASQPVGSDMPDIPENLRRRPDQTAQASN